ncbi:MAG: sel1 repeat family protein [Alphaproteobacteria bacterium]|nr:sel1 repeat family protein [Alphaproteobacteria bacterium]
MPGLALLAAQAIATWTIAGGSARADFYDLTGRYECLGKADAVCYDTTPTLPDPRAWQSETAAEQTIRLLDPVPKGAKGAKPPPPVQANNYQDTIDRIQARKATEGDIELLRNRARTGDHSALELLAWCEYMGVGTKQDVVRAYLLYGEAAEAGSPGAKANQQLLFGRVLTQDQRQKVLDFQNGRLALDLP